MLYNIMEANRETTIIKKRIYEENWEVEDKKEKRQIRMFIHKSFDAKVPKNSETQEKRQDSES